MQPDLRRKDRGIHICASRGISLVPSGPGAIRLYRMLYRWIGGGMTQPAIEDLTARARIRQAALTHFAEHGYDRATIRGIAASAGVEISRAPEAMVPSGSRPNILHSSAASSRIGICVPSTTMPI